jgi:hypothetical protein
MVTGLGLDRNGVDANPREGVQFAEHEPAVPEKLHGAGQRPAKPRLCIARIRSRTAPQMISPAYLSFSTSGLA